MFSFKNTATTEIYTLSLHNALPISGLDRGRVHQDGLHRAGQPVGKRLRGELQRPASGRTAQRRDLLLASGGRGRDRKLAAALQHHPSTRLARDRKSTRLNSSHANISYAVFCLKKKN